MGRWVASAGLAWCLLSVTCVPIDESEKQSLPRREMPPDTVPSVSAPVAEPSPPPVSIAPDTLAPGRPVEADTVPAAPSLVTDTLPPPESPPPGAGTTEIAPAPSPAPPDTTLSAPAPETPDAAQAGRAEPEVPDTMAVPTAPAPRDTGEARPLAPAISPPSDTLAAQPDSSRATPADTSAAPPRAVTPRVPEAPVPSPVARPEIVAPPPAAPRRVQFTVVPAAPPAPDSLRSSLGLWAYAPEISPVEDALLFRVAQALWSMQTLRSASLLKPEIQAREDSIPWRMLPPRRAGQKLNDQTTPVLAGQIDAGTVEIGKLLREVAVGPRVRLRREDYLQRLTRATFRQLLIAESQRSQASGATAASRRGLVKISLPVELPSQLRTIFGEGKPNLSVSGSERITFSGTSRWRPNQPGTEIARRQSKFPQLDMKQELNLKLTGTIGDKVSVDVDQSSQTTTPLANRIKIRYDGYDDEILQKIDLGNTSLSLPGTQYVSYGGRAEGLFGINAQARLGDVDITTILSKQEGKSDAKSVTREAETRTTKIADLDYIRGKYFFLRSPNGCPWRLDKGSIEVYIDDQNGTNDNGAGNPPRVATSAAVTLDGERAPSDSTYVGKFHRLTKGDTPDAEYTIEDQGLYAGHPIIILRDPLNENYALAVQYSYWDVDVNYNPILTEYHVVGSAVGDSLRLKMLRPPQNDERVDWNDLRSGVWGSIRDLEMRNVYDLGARGILAEGFDLAIRVKRTDGATVNPDRILDRSFLEMTGLDLSIDTGTGPTPGHDGKVDDYLIDYTSGLLYFPDLRPFDPDSSDLCYRTPACNGFSLCRFLFPGRGDNLRTDRVALPGFPRAGADSAAVADSASKYRAPGIYDRIITQNPDLYSRYYLELRYRSPVSRIQLNAFGILPGSEVVTASNRTLVRDRDYKIDYEAGEVEILDAAGVTEKEEIRVTYSYVGFSAGGASRTLAGSSAAFRPEDSAFHLSTAWLYESRGGLPGVEGRRPRLGQEPSRTVVGELAGTWKGESMLLTRLIDELPGLDAIVPSKLELAFGAGISLPNPNTKDKLYLDDFDGVKDVLALSMSRLLWRPSSIPISRVEIGADPADTSTTRPDPENKGELWWYSPLRAVRERDLQPTLEDREGDDNRQVLRMRVFPRGDTPDERRRSWSGVTTAISRYGADLSRAQFLDVWVNDFRQWRPQPVPPGFERRGRLVIDIGTTSEDAIWYRNDPRHPEAHRTRAPNDTLDTEDRDGDLQLDVGSNLDEDTGLDRREQGTAGADPNDGYEFDEGLEDDSPEKYAHVNGTEGNRTLDSEDLNGDNQLDRIDSYFQIAVDLADSNLWETDVYRDYVYQNPDAKPDWVKPENGWRRIRIPLRNDTLVTERHDPGAAPPVWEKIFHCRVWVTGFEDSTTVELGGIEITGNRWFENPIADLRDRPVPDSTLADGEEFFVGVLNNKDDAAIYDTPIRTRKQEGITEREQSITLNMRQFPPGHRCSIYRTYGQRQDYTLYEKMEFFVKQRPEAGETDLACSVRLCRDAASDTTNYYEYRVPITRDWNLVTIDFAEMSQLQLVQPDSLNQPIVRDLGGGRFLIRKGSPSLTSIQRIGFFVTNTGSGILGRGSVWINELRLTSVKKDVGTASRFALGADLTRLGRYNFNWERREADFLKIGQDRGSGTTSTTWNLNGSTDLFGYAEVLGLTSNLRGALSDTRSVPKFRTESDLIVDKPSDRDISHTRAEEVNATLARRRSARWWSRYLLEPFSFSGGWRRSLSVQPVARDTTVAQSGSASWNFPLEQWGDVPLDKDKRYRLRYLPTSLSASLTGGRTSVKRYTRTDLFQPYTRQPSPVQSTGALNLGSGLRPFTPITYQVSSARDLKLRRNQLRVAGLNLGREVSRQHGLTTAWQVPILRQALGPSANWQSSSTLRFAQIYTGGAEGDPDRVNEFQNSRTLGFSARLSPSELWRSIGRARARMAGDTSAATTPRTDTGGLSRHIRIAPIGGNLTFTRQTGYSGQTGEPGLLYQLGITDSRGGSARSLSRARTKNSTARNLSLDTNANLPAGITVGARFSDQRGKSSDNGLVLTTLTRKWPDLSISWGSLHQRLRLDRVFRNFTANTSYNREYTESGSSQAAKDHTTVRTNYSPFLNINATLKNGVTAGFSSSARSSTDDVYRPSRNTTTHRERQFGLTLKKTLNLTRRVTVPLTGRTQTMQTRLDLNADFNWNGRKTQTQSLGVKPTVTEDRQNWKFTTGAGYQFTQNINGNASINFGQDKDNENQTQTARFIGISLSASFNF